MRNLLSRLFVASALLPVLLISSASPAAGWDPNPTFPKKGISYNCKWWFTDGPYKEYSGTAKLDYPQIVCNKLRDGNTLCRPVRARNTYPHGGVREENVTIAKPFSCGPRCSISEYTVGSANPPIQCKAFRAEVNRTGPGDPRFFLQFRECDNFVQQDCEAP